MRYSVFLLFFALQLVFSQTVDWESVYPNYIVLGKAIATDSQNNVISTGNALPTGAYNEYAYTQKLTLSGNVIWKDSIATVMPNNYHSTSWVGTDSNDDIFVVGYRFTLTGSTQVPNAIKVFKYSANGTLLNNVTIEGVFGSGANTNLGYQNKAEIDEMGNLYLATAGTVNTGEPSGYLLLKFDNSGNLIWSRKKVFSNIHAIRNMDYNNGRIALIGKTTFSDFNNEMVVWDENGNELWFSNNGQTNQTWGTDVVLDNAGNTFALTQVYENLTYGIHLVKYDLNGNVVFTNTYFLNNDSATSGRLGILPNGNVVVTGTNWSVAGNHLYVAEVSAQNGNVITDNTFVLSYNNNWVYNLDIAPSGNYYVSGKSDSDGGAPSNMFLFAFSPGQVSHWNTSYSNEGVMPIGFTLDSQENLFALIENKYTVVKFNNNLSTLGLQDIKEDTIVMYPNPVIDELYFSADGVDAFSVFDVNGSVVKHSIRLSQPIDLSVLNSGLYFISFYKPDGSVVTKKILKY